MSKTFNDLIISFTPTIFTWDFYCDFIKAEKNAFDFKVQLNLLNSLLGEKNIDDKFISLIREYPRVKNVLPLLIAVRNAPQFIMQEIDTVYKIDHLFKVKHVLNTQDEQLLLNFFNNSGLKSIFENKKITNLTDYVFGVEVGLDSNGRKNRSGKTMEGLVENFIKDFCLKKSYKYKIQATASWIMQNWSIEIKSDKSKRKFDFAIYNGEKVFLLETNFYGGGGSKLKSVAGEFSALYEFMKLQNVPFFWVTDGSEGWKTANKPLEDAHDRMDGNIYNLSMLENGLLDDIIR